MNRRDFIVRSTAAAGFGVAALAIAGENMPRPEPPSTGPLPHKVILDARFRQSCEFGASAVRMGCKIRPIHGDITALWFDELQPHWTRSKEAIVGMTTAASLLCLEQLAWEQWMRVVARIEHHCQPDGTVRHRLVMPENALAESRTAIEGNGVWAERLFGSLVKRTDAEYGRAVQSVLYTRSAYAAPALSLVSWVIAARSVATPNVKYSTQAREASI